MSGDDRLAVGLVQMESALGDRARNLERHRQWVRQAGEAGVKLLVFPELSLTGYFLKDLVAESAIPLEGDVIDELRGLSDGLDVVLGAVIEEPDHRYFNASLYFSRGELVHVHRRCTCQPMACSTTNGISRRAIAFVVSRPDSAGPGSWCAKTSGTSLAPTS